MRNSPIRLQLTGGLGNQLFSYAAALLMAQKTGRTLIIDSSVSERVFKRKPDLFEFRLCGESRVTLNQIAKSDIFLDRLFWKFNLSRKLTSRYQSPVLGDDRKIFESSSIKYLRGFFQTKKNPEIVRENIGFEWAELRTPSANFLELAKKLENQQVIGLHVRRGDYRNYSNEFGLLSSRYYEEAINTLSTQLPDSQLWLFSDEPSLVVKEFNDAQISFAYVANESDLSPAETLIIMSKLSGLVIANSTFSWWAAFLSKGQVVAAPKPWFKNEGSWLKEDSLIPKHWFRCKSDWTH